jgi:hypothetical protein
MLENGSVNRNRSIDRRLCRVRVRLLLDTPGYRLDVSRNLWDGSGLKVDSALMDVGWCVEGTYTHFLVCVRSLPFHLFASAFLAWPLVFTSPYL